MASLDRDPTCYNTPAARAARINAPSKYQSVTWATYPREIPQPLRAAMGTHRGGVVLYGPPGLGKTALGICMLRDLAAAGMGSMEQWNLALEPGVIAAELAGEITREPAPCWFESFSRLLRTQRRSWVAQDEGGLDWFAYIEQHVRALMLDDIGVDTSTPFRESFLLQHLEWAQDTESDLILTLNAPPAEWKHLLGPRCNDRLLDASFLKVPFTGESLR